MYPIQCVMLKEFSVLLLEKKDPAKSKSDKKNNCPLILRGWSKCKRLVPDDVVWAFSRSCWLDMRVFVLSATGCTGLMCGLGLPVASCQPVAR